MPNLKNIKVIPQRGHGVSEIVSAKVIPEHQILATLDEGYNLVLWDMRSGKQLEDLSLKSWSKTSDEKKELIKNKGLQKYVQAAIRKYVDVEYRVAEAESPLGNTSDWLGEENSFVDENNRMEIRQELAASAFNLRTEQFQLYEADGHLCLRDLISDQREKFAMQDNLVSALADIQEFSHNKEKGILAIRSLNQLAFFQTTANGLVWKKNWSVSERCWLSPDSGAAVWVEENSSGRQLILKVGRYEESLVREIKLKREGPVHHIIADEKMEYVALACPNLLVAYKITDSDEPAPLLREEMKSARPAAFSIGEKDHYLVTTQFAKEGVPIALWDLCRAAPEKKFYGNMPKILKMEMAGRESHINMLLEGLDSRVIYSMQVGQQFQLKKRAVQAGPAVSNPMTDYLLTFAKKGAGQFEIVQGEKVITFSLKETPFEEAGFSPDGQYLCIAHDAGGLSVLETGQFTEKLNSEGNDKVLTPQVLCRIDLNAQEQATAKRIKINHFVFHPNKKELAVSYQMGPSAGKRLVETVCVHIFDFSGKKPEGIFYHHIDQRDHPGFNINFSSYGKYFLLRSSKTVGIWASESWRAQALTDRFPHTGEAYHNVLDYRQKVDSSGSTQAFRISENSPVFIPRSEEEPTSIHDFLILTESGDTNRIEIWNLVTLRTLIADHSGDRQGFPELPEVSIDTAKIPYASFLVMKTKPIIFFFGEGDEWIQMFDWKRNELLATIFPVNEQKIMILDPRNFYYTSADGHDLAAFQVGEKVYPAEQFDLLLNRPDLVLRHIGLSSPELIETYQKIVQKRLEKVLEERIGDKLAMTFKELNLDHLVLPDKVANDIRRQFKIKLADFLKSIHLSLTRLLRSDEREERLEKINKDPLLKLLLEKRTDISMDDEWLNDNLKGFLETMFENIPEKAVDDSFFDRAFRHLPQEVLKEQLKERFDIFKKHIHREEPDENFQLPEITILEKAKIPGFTQKNWLGFSAQLGPSAVEEKFLRFNIYVNDVPLYGKQGVSLNEEILHLKENTVNVELDKKDIKLKLSSIKKATGELIFRLEVNLCLSQGNNKVQISLVNRDGIESFETFYIQKVDGRHYSQAADHPYGYGGPHFSGGQVSESGVSAAAPRMYVIGIGISQHELLDDLKFPAINIQSFIQQFLLNKQGGLDCSLSQVHAYVAGASLEWDGLKKDNPNFHLKEGFSKDDILSLRTTLRDTNVDDRVIIFYCGHGLLNEEEDLFLSTFEVDPLNPSKAGIALEELEDLLDGIPARNKLILLDACNSGEVDPRAGFDLLDLMKETFVDLRRSAGAFVISSSGGRELAFENPEWGGSAFTQSLLRVMEEQTQITVSELQEFLAKGVSELTKGLQQPRARKKNISNNWRVW